jgi:hypothetical protein
MRQLSSRSGNLNGECACCSRGLLAFTLSPRGFGIHMWT